MLVHVCPSCVGGRPPHSQGRNSGIADLWSGGAEYGPSFSGISVKAYLVNYDLNIMSLVLMLRLSGFFVPEVVFSLISHLLRPNTQDAAVCVFVYQGAMAGVLIFS